MIENYNLSINSSNDNKISNQSKVREYCKVSSLIGNSIDKIFNQCSVQNHETTAILIRHELRNIKKSSLDGCYQQIQIANCIKNIEALMTESSPDEQKILQSTKEQLEYAGDFSENVDDLILCKYDVNDMASLAVWIEKKNQVISTLKDKVKNLNVQESILIPCSSSSLDKPHVICFKVHKNTDNSYNFEIINSGLGIENHKRKFDFSFAPKKVKTLEFANIDSDLMESFLTKIVHFNTGSIEPKGRKNGQKFYSINDIYKECFHHFKKCKEGKGRWHNIQTGGICANKSLVAWLHGYISPGETKNNRNSKQEKLYLKLRLTALKKARQMLKEQNVRNFINNSDVIYLPGTTSKSVFMSSIIASLIPSYFSKITNFFKPNHADTFDQLLDKKINALNDQIALSF